jgi:hypothetical protein
MPFRKLESDLTYCEYNPKRPGKVRFDEIEVREMTEEQKKAFANARKK